MNTVELDVHPCWAVPLVRVQHPDAETLCASLRELFLAREADGERFRNQIRRTSQHGVFESAFNLHLWSDPPVRSLFQFLHTALVSVVRYVNGYSADELKQLRFDYHSWFHVTRTGGHQTTHNHPNASWSGIFCVDPGDPVAEFPESGTVRLHDPRAGAGMYRDPGNDNLIETFRLANRSHHHQAGLLVLFPSFINHEVLPYAGSRPRIIVAFNAWCWAGEKLGRGRGET